MTPAPFVPKIKDDVSGNDRGSSVVSVLTSACLHLLVLLLLALWVVPSFSSSRDRILIVRNYAAGEVVGHLDTIKLPALLPPPSSDLEMPVEVKGVVDVADIELPMMDTMLTHAESKTEVSTVSLLLPSLEPNVASPSATGSVESAVDGITAELLAKLEKGDLLVVWLLDSSHSLVDDRQRVAARLTPFYEDIVGDRDPSSHQLLSAVVSYGNSMRERVAPTEFGVRIVKAVGKLPVDRSGKEKVFDAVAKCAEQYRKNWKKKQLAIVIWTDESGDDVQHLENAIDVCREKYVSVSVVGPSSVLGADTGLHSYTDPKTSSVFQLPVLRGPETPKPERLELGYWHMTRTQQGRRGRGRGQGGQLPSWLGGQDLSGILSTYSPYALTRLAMQSGGSYTIFDRPEDRGPFDPALMQQYMPSYGSLAEYETEIQSSPLRIAVLKAVGELSGKKVDAPPMMLFTKKTGPRVFDFIRYYYPPNEFLSKLRATKGRIKIQASRSSAIVNDALRHLSTDDSLELGLEDYYRYEKSPRWRAWYDLTRGRLLATSVRLEEYRLTMDAITRQGTLVSSTNHVILSASGQLRSDSGFRRQAGEAVMLLERCVSENRGTPWEILAQRELDYALGLGYREMSLTPTRGGPASRQPTLPKF